jgi:hypothetical protein
MASSESPNREPGKPQAGLHSFCHHRSAWTTSDIGAREQVAEPLEPRHIEALGKALARVNGESIATEDITRESFPLDDMADDISRWVEEVQEGRGIVLLTGFPVDRFGKSDCGRMYYGLGAHFGEAQSQSMMGDKLGDVVNVGGKDTRERAYRNSVELSLHTDASDIVAMMCLVQAKEGGVSGYCSGPAVYNHFLAHHPDLLEVLLEGFHYHLFGEQPPGEDPVTGHKIPVFSWCDDTLSVSYLRSYIELAFSERGLDKSPLESRALDTFDQVAHSPEFRLDYLMEPGDISFFNNYTILHTRSGFEDDEDPQKRRHLLRLWLKAWNQRPVVDNIGTYKSRKGIARQSGRGTYYKGQAEYVETLPPEREPVKS